MPTLIGTFPILNNKFSNIDENGIQTISYVITCKQEDVARYTPKKDEEYYGLDQQINSENFIFEAGSASIPSAAGNVSKYLVTNVGVDLLAGGLAKIFVTTIGSQNVNSAPRVSLLPNQPLIFGLASGSSELSLPSTTSGQQGAGIARGGVGIQVTFICKRDSELSIINTYSNKVLPLIINGTPMPTPARQPFVNRTTQTSSTGLGVSPASEEIYYGFKCVETSFDRRGGVSLFRLFYKEQGYYSVYNCTTPPGGTTTTCTSTTIYSFVDY